MRKQPAITAIAVLSAGLYVAQMSVAQAQTYKADDIVKLSTLPPREEVYAALLGAIDGGRPAALVSAMTPASVFQLPNPAVGLLAVLGAHVENLKRAG